MKHYSFLFLILLMFSGCNDQETTPETDSEYIIFGHYYGFCVGEGCIQIYKLTDTNLFENEEDTYPSPDNHYRGGFKKLDQSKFEKLETISFHIPSELLNEKENVIGTPDAADGGGIYLELSDGSFWLLDMSKEYLPEYLHPLREQIRTAISLINE